MFTNTMLTSATHKNGSLQPRIDTTIKMMKAFEGKLLLLH